jgi:hypothetical protein
VAAPASRSPMSMIVVFAGVAALIAGVVFFLLRAK